MEAEYIDIFLKQPWRLYRHFLRQYRLINEINELKRDKCKVHSNDSVADPVTKALSQQKHDGHTSSMSIRYMGNWL